MSQAPPAETVVPSVGDAAVIKDNKKAEEWKPRITVFNLPAGVTSKDELRDLCKPFGSITDVEFVPAKGNRTAFGFVTFKTKGDADYAIYRLNEDKFGGKLPVRAKYPPEKPVAVKKEEGVAGEEKKKPVKPKKPLTSLSLLTPKNVASNAPQNQQFQQKKGWDVLAPVQNQQPGQGQKKQNYQQTQQGGDPNRPQNPRNNNKKRGPNPNAPQGQQGQGQQGQGQQGQVQQGQQGQGQQGQGQQTPQNTQPAVNHQKPVNQQGNNGQHPNQQNLSTQTKDKIEAQTQDKKKLKIHNTNKMSKSNNKIRNKLLLILKI